MRHCNTWGGPFSSEPFKFHVVIILNLNQNLIDPIQLFVFILEMCTHKHMLLWKQGGPFSLEPFKFHVVIIFN